MKPDEKVLRIYPQKNLFSHIIGQIDNDNIGISGLEKSLNEVLIKSRYTLVSRGSEIWRRYVRPEAIQQKMMGYCLTGEIVEIGSLVNSFSVGDKVAAVAPHSEYVSVDTADKKLIPSIVKLPDEDDLK